MPDNKTNGPTNWSVVVLAAGSSSRMGTPKQLLLWQNETLLRRAAQTALAWTAGNGETRQNAGPVCIVLGANADLCRPALDGLPVEIVVNEAWESGMAGSLALGVRALLKTAPQTGGVLVLLCDTPRVQTAHLNRLWAAHLLLGLPVTASAFFETFGPPALFAASVFPALLTANGNEGAKKTIARFMQSGQAHLSPLPEAADDVDTPADYLRVAPRAAPP